MDKAMKTIFVSIECGECSITFGLEPKLLHEVEEDGAVVYCPHCGSALEIEHDEETHNGNDTAAPVPALV